MSRETADIIGSVGAKFTATVTSGTIGEAKLNDAPLSIGPDNRSVTINGLPQGDSTVELAMAFAPGDAAALIGVGEVVSGSARVRYAPAPGYIPSNQTAATIQIFGEQQ